ncbi:unnamed protein product [Lota lota]
MGPLFLLSSTLFFCWTMVGADTSFTIRAVTLTIEPGNRLLRDANATLRCRAVVSTLGSQELSHAYTFYKDNTVVYTKNSAGSELAYSLLGVRYFNTGKYKCRVDIEGQGKTSDPSKLTVSGVSVPFLQLSTATLSEGEDLTAKCTAPGESGSIFFYFYADGKELLEQRGKSNHAETKLSFGSGGVRRVHCEYTVVLSPGFIKSNESNHVSVTVRELSFKPVLEIRPVQEIFEGDQLSVYCRIEGYHRDPDSIKLILSHGTRLLKTGRNQINSSIDVFPEDSGEFECRLEIGNVVKTATETLSVIELFSVPRLSVSPAEVFQGDKMLLTCSSDVLVARKLSPEDISYTMDTESQLAPGPQAGRFSGSALPYRRNYTCTAVARGIAKRSKALLVVPRVSVVQPRISVVGGVILGRPFQIQCLSEQGSLPITYTLYKEYEPMNNATVSRPYQEALFTATIHQPSDISRYMCEATNNPQKDGELSKRLNTTVIAPLSAATLTVLPAPGEIFEGNTVYLICGVTGTPPVTFKWYRTDRSQPLFTGTTNKDSMDHQVHGVGHDDSDTYYCEALNHARNLVSSQLVLIEVRMALWKKGVIAASCLLVLCVVVLLCVLRLKSRRGKKEVTTELSVKPSSSKSDDSLTVSLTHDTEAYTAATVTVDRTTSSMWSVRPATAASDEEASVGSREPDVEYTEVVHPLPADPAKVVLKKGTDTVYTELQNSPLSVAAAAADHEYGSLQYADLKNTDPLVSRDDNHHHCLPVPVD